MKNHIIYELLLSLENAVKVLNWIDTANNQLKNFFLKVYAYEYQSANYYP